MQNSPETAEVSGLPGCRKSPLRDFFDGLRGGRGCVLLFFAKCREKGGGVIHSDWYYRINFLCFDRRSYIILSYSTEEAG